MLFTVNWLLYVDCDFHLKMHCIGRIKMCPANHFKLPIFASNQMVLPVLLDNCLGLLTDGPGLSIKVPCG